MTALLLEMKKKRLRDQSADLPPDEQERRRTQRERQKIAYAMRHDGRKYVKSSIAQTKQIGVEPKANKAVRSSEGAGSTLPPAQVRLGKFKQQQGANYNSSFLRAIRWCPAKIGAGHHYRDILESATRREGASSGEV